MQPRLIFTICGEGIVVSFLALAISNLDVKDPQRAGTVIWGCTFPRAFVEDLLRLKEQIPSQRSRMLMLWLSFQRMSKT